MLRSARHPEASYLITTAGAQRHRRERMPFNGPPFLTSSEIHVVKRWIEIGRAAISEKERGFRFAGSRVRN